MRKWAALLEQYGVAKMPTLLVVKVGHLLLQAVQLGCRGCDVSVCSDAGAVWRRNVAYTAGGQGGSICLLLAVWRL
jgi:hypothetical protein